MPSLTYKVVDAEGRHHVNASKKKKTGELTALAARWAKDPNYNPGFHLNIVDYRNDASGSQPHPQAQDAHPARLGPCQLDRPPLNFGVVVADSRCYYQGRNHSNLGDMIQSLAAAERLPAHSVSRFDRDNGSLATPRKGITVVWFNAWWGEAWPHARTPHKNIVPILTGVHASGSFAQQLAHSERMRAWFRRHGPVGARDFGTVRLFSSLGIPAWFSGCPTSLTS